MTITITAIYAGVLFFLMFVLGAQAGLMRAKTGISIGWGDNEDLGVRVRRHGNFTEAVPYALILMAITEVNGANATLLHVLGVALVVARLCHAFGLQVDSLSNPLRGIGAGGTTLVSIVLAGLALYQALT